MALEISHLTDDELTTYTRIHAESFRYNLNRLLYTGPISISSQAILAQNLQKNRSKNSDYHLLKATDKATGEIIGCAKWIFHPNGRTQEELDDDSSHPIASIPEANPAAWEAFFNLLSKEKNANFGARPFFELSALFTDSNHYRRGAGGSLLRWGTEQADKAGLPCYLEATVMGKPLYERHGFHVVRELTFDATEFGVDDFDTCVAMIREPKA